MVPASKALLSRPPSPGSGTHTLPKCGANPGQVYRTAPHSNESNSAGAEVSFPPLLFPYIGNCFLRTINQSSTFTNKIVLFSLFKNFFGLFFAGSTTTIGRKVHDQNAKTDAVDATTFFSISSPNVERVALASFALRMTLFLLSPSPRRPSRSSPRAPSSAPNPLPCLWAKLFFLLPQCAVCYDAAADAFA